MTESPGAAMSPGAAVSRGGVIGRHAVFLALAVLSGVVLLYLARRTTFWQDEWGVIDYQRSLADILRPLNEHWSTIPILLYRTTFSIVGLQSYLPYIAQVIVLHLIAVAAAAPELPRPLYEQLVPGGRIVVPVGRRRAQRLELVVRSPEGPAVLRSVPCRFVPLLGAEGFRE